MGVAKPVRFDTGVWGGTRAFRRDATDLDAFVADLRRTVGDDALLAARADGIEPPRSLAPTGVLIVIIEQNTHYYWIRILRGRSHTTVK
ncbi:MAG: hypothetical protein R6U01_05750 [Halorubrum sp.]|uniref:hypothetical protein n=1 Tax=Halorubrum sp. TaxID=1879286 RepID=UPI0039704E51